MKVLLQTKAISLLLGFLLSSQFDFLKFTIFYTFRVTLALLPATLLIQNCTVCSRQRGVKREY
ncbi:MAG: hypothetical protein JWQ40_5182 [Segetibacter sp.]|nr:hypothetical protein [Segetibacter sp.]